MFIALICHITLNQHIASELSKPNFRMQIQTFFFPLRYNFPWIGLLSFRLNLDPWNTDPTPSMCMLISEPLKYRSDSSMCILYKPSLTNSCQGHDSSNIVLYYVVVTVIGIRSIMSKTDRIEWTKNRKSIFFGLGST